MAKPAILTTDQQGFLQLIANEPSLTYQFYLTGGTALAGFYIPYRLSEDLDFFSDKEVDHTEIQAFIKANQAKLCYTKLEISQSFNRNLVFLDLPAGQLKLEFTYFPFPQAEPPMAVDGLRVDSLLDIALNKIFTIYQKPRSRDYMDLYMILKQEHWLIDDLIAKAKIKFDWHIDPLQLGSQFLRVTEIKDLPKLIQPLNNKDWQGFFLAEAKKMGAEVTS